MSAIITLKNVTKHYLEDDKNLLVLDDINLEIEAGEFFILVGPSGSGKSTILRIISGLEKDYKGEVILSKDMTVSDTSFVFQ